MAKIKVTRGSCGIRYTDANGRTRSATKTAADGFFECDDKLAARFVGLGVAVYEATKEAAAPEDPAEDPDQEAEDEADQGTGEETTAHLDAAQLSTMTIKELAALAADMGVDVSGCKKKDDYVAAIAAVEVTPGDAEDDLPDLDAADPV